MKFVFTVVAFLVCANLYVCQAKKWWKRPSAHIVSHSLGVRTYGDMVIKDFNATSPESRLEAKMTYKDGELTVPKPGVYNIYAQIYYHSKARIHVHVNNKVVAMMQPPTETSGSGTLSTSGMFRLKAGDVIYLKAHPYPVYNSLLYMQAAHTYFGAHRVGA